MLRSSNDFHGPQPYLGGWFEPNVPGVIIAAAAHWGPRRRCFQYPKCPCYPGHPTATIMHRAFVFAAATALVSSVLGSPVARSCSSPYTRKEWRELSTTEQTQFITALKCLGELPHSTLVPTNYTAGIVSVNPSSSRYDDFVYAHMDTNVKDHFTGPQTRMHGALLNNMLYRHRWYLTAFEKELRTQCDYTGYLPYWDWSLDSGNVVASPVFSSSTTTGFGSFGVAPGYQVTDGAFATVQRAYPTPHVIARNFKAKPFEEQVFPFEFTTPDLLAADTFTPAKITEIVNGFSGDFIGFAAHMDGVRAQGMHNAAHLMTRPGGRSAICPTHRTLLMIPYFSFTTR
ncbi:Tyrosinase domain-containing protein [Rhizoctonia solani AG-1 IA]|uniref:Tyrosinase domain-containing protein n=1 Tax=Thanatephorus cucumeris (strain AG1-IA) TaxID=983506 RepID=L8WRV6_THACA|nr:Tyrosinase domain-containing protein [Rhizoctonia solani AG-1 IA]